MDLKPLRSSLYNWYHQHKRDLPWRETHDPYAIWLSEVILQQTRVNQGLPYYRKFIEHYPSVEDLANAAQDQVLKDWEGLGYYSRARNLQAAAQMVRDQYSGVFPQEYEQIRALKGVGDYTAAAIASFAFGLPKAVVDGNVYRVLSRLTADGTPINTGAGKKRFQSLANDWLDPDRPALHNQAIMEFGALQCVPKNPDCAACPLAEACLANQSDRVSEFPVKQRKTYDRVRFLNYFHLVGEEGAWVENRSEGIWKGLWQFPLLETDAETDWPHLVDALDKPELKVRPFRRHKLPKHKLSHQTLHIQVWELQLAQEAVINLFPAAQLVGERELKQLAFPRPLRRYLDENQLTLPLD